MRRRKCKELYLGYETTILIPKKVVKKNILMSLGWKRKPTSQLSIMQRHGESEKRRKGHKYNNTIASGKKGSPHSLYFHNNIVCTL